MILLKPLHVFPTPSQLVSTRISPDGNIVVAGGIEGGVFRWRLDEKKLEALATLAVHHAHVGALAFHPTEPWLYSGDSWGRLRCQTFVDEAPPAIWEHESAHDGWLRALAVAPDGEHIGTCGRDQVARLWTKNGKLVQEYRHDDDLFNLTFTPDGGQIVLGDQHCHLLAWDFKANKIVRTLDATVMYKLDRLQDICGLRILTFSHDKSLLLAAGTIPAHGATIESTPIVLAFDPATGKEKHKFIYGTPKDGFIEGLAVLADGTLIAGCSSVTGAGKFFQFKVSDKELIGVPTPLGNCRGLALHPDGARFVYISSEREKGGNGKKLEADGAYAWNTCPVNLFEIPGMAKVKPESALNAAVDAKVK